MYLLGEVTVPDKNGILKFSVVAFRYDGYGK